MLHSYQRTVSARDFCRVLFRHRVKASAFFTATVALVLLGILLTPKTYVSETKLFLRLGRESVGIDPTATTGGQTISLSYSRESEIQSVQNLLESRVMFEQTVDKLGPAVVLEEDSEPSPATKAMAGLFAWVPTMGKDDPTQNREQAIRKLIDATAIENPMKSHVFTISYKARSPERAQQVLKTYLDVCLENYVRVHRNPGSRQFFVEQSALLGEQVKQATQELRDAKNEVGLVSVESQRKILEDNISALDRELLPTETELASSQNRIVALRQQVPEGVDESLASTLSTRAIDDMRAQLYTLQIQEREVLSKFTPEHPRALAIHEQVEQAQNLLNRQELFIELSNASALQAKKQSLSEQYEATRSKLRALNEDEVRIAELERRLEQLNASHRIYLANLEQARIDQELENGHITNIAVAQPPTFVPKALSRRGQITLILGLIVASLGAIGVAYLSEYLDDSLGTPAEVESRVGLPVLMSVPWLSETHFLSSPLPEQVRRRSVPVAST